MAPRKGNTNRLIHGLYSPRFKRVPKKWRSAPLEGELYQLRLRAGFLLSFIDQLPADDVRYPGLITCYANLLRHCAGIYRVLLDVAPADTQLVDTWEKVVSQYNFFDVLSDDEQDR